MTPEYPVYLGNRSEYHVIEYPSGYTGLIRPDGKEVTSLTEPEDIHWYRDLKPIVDELNRMQKELERLKWQPIETAPKDGTAIVVGGIWKNPFAPPDCYSGQQWVSGVGYWTTWNGGGWAANISNQFTHWMPLPKEPNQ